MKKKEFILEIRGEKRVISSELTFGEIAALYPDPDGRVILLAMENNRLRELHHHPQEDAKVTFLTIRDAAGFNAYRRSMCLMMLKAFADVMSGKNFKVGIHFTVSDGLYCTLSGPELTDELLAAAEERMREMSDEAVPIRKFSVSTRKAEQLFRELELYDKADLLKYRISSRTNIYSLDGFQDYYYGYMVPDTSCLKLFRLQRFEDGFVLCIPDRAEPDRLPPFDPAIKLFQVQNRSLQWGKDLGIRTVAELNKKVIEGKLHELILVQEAYHEQQIASIAQKIAEDKGRRVVMIAGPSSSGKTTFSHRLSTQLSIYGLRPHPIPVDDYFVNREDTPKDEDGNYNFECLEAIDIRQFNEDMTRLLAGEKVEMPTFNFKTGKREYKGKYRQIGSNDILVIEGIHGLNDRLSYAIPRENKYKVYISALTQLNIDEHNRIPTTDGRLIRRIVRDARTRGTLSEGTIAMWPSVRRGEESYIFPYQETADVMFNSALIYELAALKVYAEPLLFRIEPDSKEYVEAKRLLKFLDYFVAVPSENIPNNSLIREFIGGSCFDV